MNATVAPRCLCSHSGWRHIAAASRCQAPGCGCTRFRRTPAPEPTPTEQAVIERFGIFTEDEK